MQASPAQLDMYTPDTLPNYTNVPDNQHQNTHLNQEFIQHLSKWLLHGDNERIWLRNNIKYCLLEPFQDFWFSHNSPTLDIWVVFFVDNFGGEKSFSSLLKSCLGVGL